MRIVALEKEVERYKVQLEAEPVQETTELSVEQLLQKISVLEKVDLCQLLTDLFSKIKC